MFFLTMSLLMKTLHHIMSVLMMRLIMKALLVMLPQMTLMKILTIFIIEITTVTLFILQYTCNCQYNYAFSVFVSFIWLCGCIGTHVNLFYHSTILENMPPCKINHLPAFICTVYT